MLALCGVELRNVNHVFRWRSERSRLLRAQQDAFAQANLLFGAKNCTLLTSGPPLSNDSGESFRSMKIKRYNIKYILIYLYYCQIIFFIYAKKDRYKNGLFYFNITYFLISFRSREPEQPLMLK